MKRAVISIGVAVVGLGGSALAFSARKSIAHPERVSLEQLQSEVDTRLHGDLARIQQQVASGKAHVKVASR